MIISIPKKYISLKSTLDLGFHIGETNDLVFQLHEYAAIVK
jgi:hypothetical protein